MFSKKKENVSNCRKYSRYGQRVAKYMGKVQRLFTAWKWKLYFWDAMHRSIMTFLRQTLINFWECRINASSEYGDIYFLYFALASMDAVCRRFAFLLEIDQLLWRIRMVYVSTRSFSLSLGWIRKDLSPNIHPKS